MELLIGFNFGQGVALRCGPKLVGFGAWPMADDPLPLMRGHVWRAGAATGKAKFSFNAVKGRSVHRFNCRHCDATFESDAEAAQHVAESDHVATYLVAYELVPVCIEDDPKTWPDGAGVSFFDRHPESEDA